MKPMRSMHERVSETEWDLRVTSRRAPSYRD
jgi:hypothetical protein